IVEHFPPCVVRGEHKSVAVGLAKLSIHSVVNRLALVGDVRELSPPRVQSIVNQIAVGLKILTDITIEPVVVFARVSSYSPRSNVVDAYREIVQKLSLNAEKPLERVGRAQIGRHSAGGDGDIIKRRSDPSVGKRRTCKIGTRHKRKLIRQGRPYAKD